MLLLQTGQKTLSALTTLNSAPLLPPKGESLSDNEPCEEPGEEPGEELQQRETQHDLKIKVIRMGNKCVIYVTQKNK